MSWAAVTRVSERRPCLRRRMGEVDPRRHPRHDDSFSSARGWISTVFSDEALQPAGPELDRGYRLMTGRGERSTLTSHLTTSATWMGRPVVDHDLDRVRDFVLVTHGGAGRASDGIETREGRRVEPASLGGGVT